MYLPPAVSVVVLQSREPVPLSHRRPSRERLPLNAGLSREPSPLSGANRERAWTDGPWFAERADERRIC